MFTSKTNKVIMSCWAQRSISCPERFARRDRRCFAALSM